MKMIKIILPLIFTVIADSVTGQYNSDHFLVNGKYVFSGELEKQAIDTYLNGNQSNLLFLILASGGDINENKINEYVLDFNEFISFLDQKKLKYKNDEKFINYLFYKVHRKYLKQYENYVSFGQLFEEGKYDCVTGSGFYALILDKLKMDYNIHETKYHVYITINASGKQFFLESTDPVNGVISDKAKIEDRIKEIHDKEKEENLFGKNFYIFNENINLHQLIGLQYFNQATSAYNNFNLTKAFHTLQKGLIFYQSDRLKEFMKLIISSYHSVEAKNNFNN